MTMPQSGLHTHPDATTEDSGVIELATDAEVIAGTDTERAVTPSGLEAWAEFPLSTLAYPEVVTGDHRLIVIPASTATAGGTVSIAAGTDLVLGREGARVGRGHLVTVTTPAWTSVDLSTSSTFYVRGRVVGGVLDLYVQQGTDDDAIPANLTGSPGAFSGGGFDSTPIDVLLARVVTGQAGSIPTVTMLANAAQLTAWTTFNPTPYNSAGNSLTAKAAHILNWARAPRSVIWRGWVRSVGGQYMEAIANQTTTKSRTRYSTSVISVTDYFKVAPTSGYAHFELEVLT